jgi:hypothetical protein
MGNCPMHVRQAVAVLCAYSEGLLAYVYYTAKEGLIETAMQPFS